MIQLDREALALAAPEMDPSPDFKARLMQRAAAELDDREAEPEPAPPPIRLRPRAAPLWLRAPWMSALAAIFVVAVVTAGGYAYENQVVASYALSGSAAGNAVVNVKRSGAAELEMSGVQDPPPGYVYEAWVIPPNSQPIPVGVTQRGTASLPLDGLSPGATVAITQERGRVDAPTSTPLMAAVVQA